MKGLCYLYWRTAVNRVKKAMKKIMTYVLLVILVVEFIVVVEGLGDLVTGMKIDNPKSFAILLSVGIFYLLPGNFISYAKRKGLLFKKSHIQLLLPSPVNPKIPILFVGMLNLWLNLFLAIFMAVLGIGYFQVSPVLMISYAFVYFVFENFLEAGIMILCYGNEKLPEKFFQILNVICYIFMGLFAVAAFLILMKEGFSFASFTKFLDLPIIQMIPVIGWNIALIRLFFIGPTVLNVICSILFLATSVFLVLLAWKSTCTGAYYEDAATFADTYEKRKANQKKGIVVLSEKKKFYKKAQIAYKAGGAKAIFYRQLLEYKKSRFFIFGMHTLLSLAVGVGIAVFAFVNHLGNQEVVERVFLIPGIMAYIMLIFSGYATKWSRELENPYTFLIPDTNIKKLWYATCIEHIRNLTDAFLLTIPGAIVLKLSVVQTLLILLIYLCLMANKLYYTMLADFFVGSYLGNVGKTLVRTILQMVVMGFSIGGAIAGVLLIGVEAGFFVMICVTTIFTALGALGASLTFEYFVQ